MSRPDEDDDFDYDYDPFDYGDPNNSEDED